MGKCVSEFERCSAKAQPNIPKIKVERGGGALQVNASLAKHESAGAIEPDYFTLGKFVCIVRV
jgi:hypothetical protein